MAKVKICPHCGTENPTSSVECRECGYDLTGVRSSVLPETSGEAAPDQVSHTADSRREEAQGTDSRTTPETDAPALKPSQENAGTEEYVKICPQCGHRNRGVAKICTNCRTGIKTVRPVFMPKEESPAPRQAAEAPAAHERMQEPDRIARLLAQDGSVICEIRSDNPVIILGREHVLGGFLRDCVFVSRRHAELSITGSRLSVKDLNSTNGTYVNDEKTEPGKQRLLGRGDRISLGGFWGTANTGCFTVEYDR